ncbi:hypothetical protein PG995_003002 [Apiospora arundinis]
MKQLLDKILDLHQPVSHLARAIRGQRRHIIRPNSFVCLCASSGVSRANQNLLQRQRQPPPPGQGGLAAYSR